ncbi:hypothetical protein B0H19DRAFT_908648, partial [Mycena capillaripes]
GMSGYLRQELRELEILDEITRLRFEGALPRSVTGLYRRRLIRSFYAWKTDHRDPPHFHPAMRWDASMGNRVPEPEFYSEWKPSVSLNKKRKSLAVTGTSKDRASEAIQPPKKRAKDRSGEGQQERVTTPLVYHLTRPVGLIWDSFDYSCVYDATFTILANLWLEDANKWTTYFAYISGFMGELATSLRSVANRRVSL